MFLDVVPPTRGPAAESMIVATCVTLVVVALVAMAIWASRRGGQPHNGE